MLTMLSGQGGTESLFVFTGNEEKQCSLYGI